MSTFSFPMSTFKSYVSEKFRYKNDLTTPVRYLKGVGPKRADILKSLGIETIEDLFFYLPRRYEDRSNFTLIKDLKPGEHQTIKAKVLSFGVYRAKRGVSIFDLAAGDGTGIIYCSWFNQPFLNKTFKPGDMIVVFGKVEKYDRLRIYHPEYELLKDESDSVNMGCIVPIYPLTHDISQRYMRRLVYEAVSKNAQSLEETLPTRLRAKKRLVDIVFTIRNIHFPHSFESLEKSYKRLVFEEFFLLQIALAKRKLDYREKRTGIRHSLDAELKSKFLSLLPFELTEEQKKTIEEIESDMSSAKPMNRLLQGEVGSGKTVIALYALLVTVSNGFQGAIMAPTEILARQHYLNMSEILMPLGINLRLLISGIPQDKKNEIKKDAEKGEVDIICGTHALIQEGVKYKNLSLVIIDEQHKFGVTQRAVLKEKGLNPDVLIMTATPIPRTLAMTVYGDLDISIIKQLPENRKPITTYWVEEERRDFVYKFIREEAEKGRQAYIVYPRISKRPDSKIKAAASMYYELQDKIFPDLKVALIHGRMLSKEKESIMNKFKKGEYDILVSTVVIEVGVDIPNATVMVIENAERFGLAQLHQLRGRIGRGDYESYCILIGNPGTDEAVRRLSKVSETHDGFKIAEEDLELRGPGEFFGTRQHGLPELRFGNILKDFEIMEDARKEAFLLVENDPALQDPRNNLLKRTFIKRFGRLIV